MYTDANGVKCVRRKLRRRDQRWCLERRSHHAFRFRAMADDGGIRLFINVDGAQGEEVPNGLIHVMDDVRPVVFVGRIVESIRDIRHALISSQTRNRRRETLILALYFTPSKGAVPPRRY